MEKGYKKQTECLRVAERLQAYGDWLAQEEKSLSTRRQYVREAGRFLEWLGARRLAKEYVILYKEKLAGSYKPASVNAKLAAVNGFLGFEEHGEMKVKLLRIQRSAYCPGDRQLGRNDYQRLVAAAKAAGDGRMWTLLQTVCATGIRISELPFITAEAVEDGEAVVRLKGKSRVVLLPEKLRRLLRKYLRRRGISHGPVFVTRNGKPLDRSNIWKRMKRLGQMAAVPAGKVFPHNLRHLFARCFYEAGKDIAKLADVLGHSSINTTRLYIISTGQEHRKQLEGLGLLA